MISVTITGQNLEEFKNRLEEVAIQFLTEKENKVTLNNSNNAINNEEIYEEESKEASEKREVIPSKALGSTPETVNVEGVQSLNEATSIKRKAKKLSIKPEPIKINTEVLKEKPQIDLSELKLPEMPKVFSKEEAAELFKNVIAKDRELAKAVLSKFNVPKFSELPEEAFSGFATECEKVLNG